MATPQQPELARSRKVASLEPDATESLLEGQKDLGESGRVGQVPEDNLPGHHPEVEQDKPDGDKFLAKLHDRAAEAESDGVEGTVAGLPDPKEAGRKATAAKKAGKKAGGRASGTGKAAAKAAAVSSAPRPADTSAAPESAVAFQGVEQELATSAIKGGPASDVIPPAATTQPAPTVIRGGPADSASPPDRKPLEQALHIAVAAPRAYWHVITFGPRVTWRVVNGIRQRLPF